MKTNDEEKISQTAYLWAKTGSADQLLYHPLILHLLDVATCADAILNREPETTRQRMAAVLGLPWEEAKPWLLILIACHDLGKACPGFQCKWMGSSTLLAQAGLRLPRSPDTDINHAFVSQLVLFELLVDKQWPEGLAELVSAAVGCHHGSRGSPTTLNDLQGNQRALGRDDWNRVRLELLEELLKVFKPFQVPAKSILTGPDFMLLSGLTSFADWIGSNEAWFPFGKPSDCVDLESWYRERRSNANKALDAIGWEPRIPLGAEYKSFEKVFGFAPRPLQKAVSKALKDRLFVESCG